MRTASVVITAVGLALFGCSANDGATSAVGAGGTGLVPVAPFGGGGGIGGAASGGSGPAFAGGANGATAPGAGGLVGAGGLIGAGGTPAMGGAPAIGGGGMGGASGFGGISGAAGVSVNAGGSGGGGMGGYGGGGMGGGGGSGGIVSVSGPLHFGPNVRVNDDTGSTPQNEVAIAASKGVLVAGWNDGRNASGRTNYECGYSVSRDGGMTWSKNFFASVQMMTSGAFDGDPGVAADDAGNFYLSCEDYSVKQIVFSSSLDQGMTFAPFASAQAAIDKPWIAAARDGTVFMSWLGQPGGFKRSLDHGQTWDPVISLGNLSRGTGIASGSNGYVHIPFATDTGQIHYVRSKDWGQTLDTGRNLDMIGSQSCTNCEPRDLPIVAVATDPTGATVVITWAGILSGGDGDDDVWALISQDGGDTWSKRLRVNDNTQASRQFQPWAAVDASGRVHVAWTDLRNGGTNAVYYANALDPAQGFGPSVEVTDKRGPANTFLGDYKGVVVMDQYVVVAWTDSRSGNPDIYVARAKLDGSAP
jgi:hypothetical protein